MLFSLVIGALPIGVIGGNFGNVWEEVISKKKTLLEEKRREGDTIKKARARFAPFETMSKLVLIDVWHERFPTMHGRAWAAKGQAVTEEEEKARRPLKGDFMGQVRLDLNLPVKSKYSAEMTLKMQPDLDTVNRDVTGQIKVKYTWTPEVSADVGENAALKGTLTLTILSAQNLLNLNLGKPHCSSNPYCMVLYYPDSPEFNGESAPCPRVWRTPVIVNNIAPQWNCSRSFEYGWARSATMTDRRSRKSPRWNSQTKVSKAYSTRDGVAVEVNNGSPGSNGSD
jgi:hypothetical protein